MAAGSSRQPECAHTASSIWEEQEVENRQEVKPGRKTSRPLPSGSLPPVKLHFLKVPQPSSTVSTAGDQVSKNVSLKGTLHTQTDIMENQQDTARGGH